MERNWYADRMPEEVPFSEIEANSDSYTHWEYEAFEPMENGYEDVEEQLKSYTNEMYQRASEERKEEIINEVLSIYRKVGRYPTYYLSDLGVMDEIEKCLNYDAKFEGDTVSCVDEETEFFNGSYWKPISKYVEGEKVLQYELDGSASLVYPEEYIHYESDEPFYLYNGSIFNSCLTGSHNIKYFNPNGECFTVKQKDILDKDLTGRIPVTFKTDGNTTINTQSLLLLAMALSGEYAFKETDIIISLPGEKLGYVLSLIAEYNLDMYPEPVLKQDSRNREQVYFRFKDSLVYNILFLKLVPTCMYDLSADCKGLFVNTIKSLVSDCVITLPEDNTSNIVLLDFLQFMFASSGHSANILSLRSGIKNRYVPRLLRYREVGYSHYNMKSSGYTVVNSKDKYCFTVPSHMLVLRRKRCIFITGNCGAGVGTALCNFMFPNLCNTPSLHDLNKKNARTMYERFYNDKFLRKAIKFCYSYKEGSPTPMAVMSGLRLVGSAPSNFRPMNAKAIYERFCPEGGIIYDPCCGFGGRLLGALSSKKNFRYVGTDPCTETMYNLHRLGDEIELVTGREDSYELHCCGSEVFKGKANSIDFVFTSPPYFNLEIYSTDETQCFNKFPELEDWLEGYVRQTIRNIHHMLKRGKYCAINIADFKVHGGELVAFVDEWIRISTEEGMPLYDTVYLGVTARAGSREFQFGEKKKENILIFRKSL